MAFVLLAMFLSGCQSDNSEEDIQVKNNSQGLEESVSKEPVTLTVFFNVPGISDDEFKTIIEEPVKKKYPYITLNILRQAKGQDVPDLIAAKQIPDLFYGNLPEIKRLSEEYQVIADLTPLIKKFNMDLTRFDPLMTNAIQDLSHGLQYSIPFTQNHYALFYNKDIFDKFGVGYPKDGMFWEDAIQLAEKVTRLDAGKQYRGLDIYNQSIEKFGASLSLNLVDPKSEKALISDKWNNIFRLAMSVYEIPGNKPDAVGNTKTPFLNGNLAMAPTFLNGIIGNLKKASDDGMNWDVVQTPSFKEAPNVAYRLDIHQLLLSNKSEHKEQAFQVIEVATSDEAQMLLSKSGHVTSLVNSEIKQQFAANLSYMKGKNLQGIFKSNPAKLPAISQYDGIVSEEIRLAFLDVFTGTTDINTALRKAKEVADQKIEEQKLKDGKK
jgi:multiple sugar transport system substrate-binding protein